MPFITSNLQDLQDSECHSCREQITKTSTRCEKSTCQKVFCHSCSWNLGNFVVNESNPSESQKLCLDCLEEHVSDLKKRAANAAKQLRRFEKSLERHKEIQEEKKERKRKSLALFEQLKEEVKNLPITDPTSTNVKEVRQEVLNEIKRMAAAGNKPDLMIYENLHSNDMRTAESASDHVSLQVSYLIAKRKKEQSQ